MTENKYKGLDSAQKVTQAFNIGEAAILYFRSWKWIIISIICAVTFAFFYIKTQNNVYRVTSTILLNDEKSKSRGDIASLLDLGVLSGGGANVDNEIEVMRSKDLMREVAMELQLYINYRVNAGLHSIDLYKNAPVVVTIPIEVLDRLQSNVAMELTPNGEGALLKGVYHVMGKKVDFMQQIESFPCEIVLQFGVLYIEKTPFAMGWEKPLEVTIVNPRDVAASLNQSISFILLQKMASVIRIVKLDENITRASDILQKVVEKYNSQTMDAHNEMARNTELFINERLALIERELSVVERSVEGYKKQNQLTDITSEAELFIQRTGLVESRLSELETERSILNYIDEFIKKPENRYRIVPNIGVDDASLVQIINDYNQLLFNRERMLRTTSESNPIVLALNTDIDNMRVNIFGGIDVVKRTLNITEKEVKKREADVSSRIREVPRQERELTEIARQQKIKEGLYIFLLEKREENSLTMTMTVPMARVIEQPSGSTPIAPRRMIIFVTALIVGFILPAGAFFLRDLLNVTIRDRHDIELLSNIPIIGELCHESEAKEERIIVMDKNTGSPITELLRAIRNNLQFLGNINNRKVMTFTSNLPKEGKTFVVTNMAVAFALTGKRVILLGLDLRNPQIRHIFKLPEAGITNYLSGQLSDWHSVVYKSEKYETLDILPAGPIPPNPNELLLSSRLSELIEELRAEYDYILIDSAPVGVISDTYLLDTLTDINIVVIRADYSTKSSLVHINRLVDERKLKNVYILVNAVNMNSHTYRYGRYGYGSEYGHYGYDHAEVKNKKHNTLTKIKTRINL